jgi:hypothetical protein
MRSSAPSPAPHRSSPPDWLPEQLRAIYRRLLPIVGSEIRDPGLDQERYRGEALHRLACERLGLGRYADRGQFPDILCQALEVKLQISPTIDLGLVSPDSDAPAQEVSAEIQHRDIRYAVAYGERLGPSRLRVTHLVVTTGWDFFTEFFPFQGRVINAKLQIRLPRGFFTHTE